MGSYWIGSTRAAYLRLARICLFWFLGLLRLIFSADYTYFSIFHISVDLALIQCPFATPNAPRNNSNNKYNVHPQQLCLCARTKPNSWGISGFKWSHGGGNIAPAFRKENVKWKSAQSASIFHSEQQQPSNIFHTDVCILNEKYARFLCAQYIWVYIYRVSVTRDLSTLWLTYTHTHAPQLSSGLWASYVSHKWPGRPPFFDWNSRFCSAI